MMSASRRNLARRVIAKPRARTVPKKTRHKHLPEENGLLPLDAPLGTYAIDQVVEEFQVSGIFQSEPGIIQHARDSVYFAGGMAIINAKGVFERGPKYRHSTHRFLEDLKLIDHLIQRNRGLDPFWVLKSTLASSLIELDVRISRIREATERIQQSLEALQPQIQAYLRSHRLKKENRRNHDPLSSSFIMELFVRLWCELRHGPNAQDFSRNYILSTEDRSRFARVLAAAWKDLGFSTTDHRGHSHEPLEYWFGDRLRKEKQFRSFNDDGFELLSDEDRMPLLAWAIADKLTSEPERARLKILLSELLHDLHGDSRNLSPDDLAGNSVDT
jgi:hypothetical protein